MRGKGNNMGCDRTTKTIPISSFFFFFVFPFFPWLLVVFTSSLYGALLVPNHLHGFTTQRHNSTLKERRQNKNLSISLALAISSHDSRSLKGYWLVCPDHQDLRACAIIDQTSGFCAISACSGLVIPWLRASNSAICVNCLTPLPHFRPVVGVSIKVVYCVNHSEVPFGLQRLRLQRIPMKKS